MAANREKFANLIAVCRLATNNDEEIVKRLVNSYNRCRQAYKDSENCGNFIDLTIHKLKEDSAKKYVHISELKTQFKAYREKGHKKHEAIEQVTSAADSGQAKRQKPFDKNESVIDLTGTNETASSIQSQDESVRNPAEIEPAPLEVDDEPEEETVKPSHIKKLESLLLALHHKIEKMECKELTLDDMDKEDSSFLLKEKYKARFMAVWNKICDLTGRAPDLGGETSQKFVYEGSRYEELNKRVSRFINKTKIFPDYGDIYDIVKRANKRVNLNFSTQKMQNLARDIFVDVGNQLQERRQKDFVSTFGSSLTDRVSTQVDPASYDMELRLKLEANRKTSKNRLDEVLNKYVQKQEMGDTDSEDDDEEEDEETVSAKHAERTSKPPSKKCADVTASSSSTSGPVESDVISLADSEEEDGITMQQEATPQLLPVQVKLKRIETKLLSNNVINEVSLDDVVIQSSSQPAAFGLTISEVRSCVKFDGSFSSVSSADCSQVGQSSSVVTETDDRNKDGSAHTSVVTDKEDTYGSRPQAYHLPVGHKNSTDTCQLLSQKDVGNKKPAHQSVHKSRPIQLKTSTEASVPLQLCNTQDVVDSTLLMSQNSNEGFHSASSKNLSVARRETPAEPQQLLTRTAWDPLRNENSPSKLRLKLPNDLRASLRNAASKRVDLPSDGSGKDEDCGLQMTAAAANHVTDITDNQEDKRVLDGHVQSTSEGRTDNNNSPKTVVFNVKDQVNNGCCKTLNGNIKSPCAVVEIGPDKDNEHTSNNNVKKVSPKRSLQLSSLPANTGYNKVQAADNVTAAQPAVSDELASSARTRPYKIKPKAYIDAKRAGLLNLSLEELNHSDYVFQNASKFSMPMIIPSFRTASEPSPSFSLGTSTGGGFKAAIASSTSVPAEVTGSNVPAEVTGSNVPAAVTNSNVPEAVTSSNIPAAVSGSKVLAAVSSCNVPSTVGGVHSANVPATVRGVGSTSMAMSFGAVCNNRMPVSVSNVSSSMKAVTVVSNVSSANVAVPDSNHSSTNAPLSVSSDSSVAVPVDGDSRINLSVTVRRNDLQSKCATKETPLSNNIVLGKNKQKNGGVAPARKKLKFEQSADPSTDSFNQLKYSKFANILTQSSTVISSQQLSNDTSKKKFNTNKSPVDGNTITAAPPLKHQKLKETTLTLPSTFAKISIENLQVNNRSSTGTSAISQGDSSNVMGPPAQVLHQTPSQVEHNSKTLNTSVVQIPVAPRCATANVETSNSQITHQKMSEHLSGKYVHTQNTSYLNKYVSNWSTPNISLQSPLNTLEMAGLAVSCAVPSVPKAKKSNTKPHSGTPLQITAVKKPCSYQSSPAANGQQVQLKEINPAMLLITPDKKLDEASSSGSVTNSYVSSQISSRTIKVQGHTDEALTKRPTNASTVSLSAVPNVKEPTSQSDKGHISQTQNTDKSLPIQKTDKPQQTQKSNKLQQFPLQIPQQAQKIHKPQHTQKNDKLLLTQKSNNPQQVAPQISQQAQKCNKPQQAQKGNNPQKVPPQISQQAQKINKPQQAQMTDMPRQLLNEILSKHYSCKSKEAVKTTNKTAVAPNSTSCQVSSIANSTATHQLDEGKTTLMQASSGKGIGQRSVNVSKVAGSELTKQKLVSTGLSTIAASSSQLVLTPAKIQSINTPDHVSNSLNTAACVSNSARTPDQVSNSSSTPGHVSNSSSTPGHVSNSGRTPGHVSNSSSTRGHVSNSISTRGHVSNSSSTRGHVSNSSSTSGYVSNSSSTRGHVSNRISTPGHLSNSSSTPGHVSKRSSTPAHASKQVTTFLRIGKTGSNYRQSISTVMTPSLSAPAIACSVPGVAVTSSQVPHVVHSAAPVNSHPSVKRPAEDLGDKNSKKAKLCINGDRWEAKAGQETSFTVSSLARNPMGNTNAVSRGNPATTVQAVFSHTTKTHRVPNAKSTTSIQPISSAPSVTINKDKLTQLALKSNTLNSIIKSKN